MTKKLFMRVLVIALMSTVVFSILATVTLAAPLAPAVDPEPARLDGGDPDNDHSPIYGPDGELLYPIYDQDPSHFGVSATPLLPTSLPSPAANGRFGDVRREDNWARVAVDATGDQLVGVAWSAWPGRGPIATGHDRQNLWVSVQVVDVTTGQVVETLDRTLSNNPREQGVLFFTYEFELPTDGHEYELSMTAKMRQNVCGNGSGSDQDSDSGRLAPTAICKTVSTDKSQLTSQSEEVAVTIDAENANHYRVIRLDDGALMASGNTPVLRILAAPDETYQAQVSHTGDVWTDQGCAFDFSIEAGNWTCMLSTSKDAQGDTRVSLGAVDANGHPVAIDKFRATSNFSYQYGPTSAQALPIPFRWPAADQGDWFVQFDVSADNGQTWSGGATCRLEEERGRHSTGQYQDFIGPVAFGAFTPLLEPGKEYFDGPRSLMYNVEYIDASGQGDVVFRFNGQEMADVTSSIFNNGSFSQNDSPNGRAVTSFAEGATKLIAYEYGAEQARIFQTVASPGTRWIHPLDQPFEHKYHFALELHGPPNVTDLLIYGDEARQVRYDDNGSTVLDLAYSQPGLIAIYPGAGIPWITVDTLIFPSEQSASYRFSETGLYHYRIADSTGHIVAGPHSSPNLEFSAQPGTTYLAQLAYPATSLYVGLYDAMQFQHTPYWTMPVDARAEHNFEFHLDYHRLDDPDLGNEHIRGDVVVDALYLINGTTSVAQQFPHGRHDGTLPGVNIVGIPTVSMVAFCQRPGVHEVVYWGGWENESYYLPGRGWVFDQELYGEWTEDQRGDCVDVAHRVNMLLAREGLRTDHTFRHHGERSQGYQMSQLHIWSPYNLAGMRAPHLGRLLKPGMVLPYYQDPEDLLFWAWDLEAGGLADGIGTAELQAYVASLGPVEYADHTGIHPPQDLN